jgi:hypothetical protein
VVEVTGMASQKQDLFATAEVADLLNLPKWRVIKFIEGEQYGIEPVANVGSGTGSRRLYNVENLCEFAVALRLLETGLRSLDIGRVIYQLREQGSLASRLRENRDLFVAILRSPFSGMYLRRQRPQNVQFVDGVEEAFAMLKPRSESALILVPVESTFRKLQKRLDEFTRKSGQANEGD